MYKVLIFIGTRPEITKMAPIIRRIEKDNELELILIHSGQHYDKEMSEIFLEQLEIRNVIENLNIGSGSQGLQTSRMIEKYEEVIIKHSPDIVLALGDTNSVVAASITCAKLNVPFGHVEAGIRSHDLCMPEEINRKIAGVTAAINFAPTEEAVLNLLYEGVDPDRIYLTGNTAVDATLEHAEIAKKKTTIMKDINLEENKSIIVLTAHRVSNVDNKENLSGLCDAICTIKKYTIIFPVHPRTEKRLIEYNLKSKLEKCKNVKLIKPLDYLNFLRLMIESKIILTDSGGLQEEAITLKKPCLTLRTNTERPETVNAGVNFLVGVDAKKIIEKINYIEKTDEIEKIFSTLKNPFGDGTASQKIIEILKMRLKEDDLKFTSPEYFDKGSLNYKLIAIKKNTTRRQIESKYHGQITLIYNEEGEPQLLQEKLLKGWKVRIQY